MLNKAVMILKTLSMSFLAATTLSVSLVQAGEVENKILMTDWTTDGKADTYIIFVNNDKIELNKWSVNISTSKEGRTRIYFDVSGPLNSCDESILPNVLSIDGRQVSMQPFCNEYIDSGQYYISFTPATDEGLEYVIQTFKSKPNDELVIVEGLGEDLGDLKPFSADGFTDAYELNRVL